MVPVPFFSPLLMKSVWINRLWLGFREKRSLGYDEGMEDKKETLLKKIAYVIEKLQSGLTQEDRANGWTEASRAAMLEVFQTLEKRLSSGEQISGEDSNINLSRGMDSWGISGGDILDHAAEISIELKKLT